MYSIIGPPDFSFQSTASKRYCHLIVSSITWFDRITFTAEETMIILMKISFRNRPMKTTILARDFIQVFKIWDYQVTLEMKNFELENFYRWISKKSSVPNSEARGDKIYFSNFRKNFWNFAWACLHSVRPYFTIFLQHISALIKNNTFYSEIEILWILKFVTSRNFETLWLNIWNRWRHRWNQLWFHFGRIWIKKFDFYVKNE